MTNLRKKSVAKKRLKNQVHNKILAESIESIQDKNDISASEKSEENLNELDLENFSI
ncbi:hypothetical protein Glove_166g7 [Diversispora epigaea]|uniref:Uncharacterized protein n=1 Tax=Diversispora epigaea TaxID=1348612 RepID=A0A397J053_9GLOM|nr:hypothetical protein Glove_166g7 [Diversispora epigaea]